MYCLVCYLLGQAKNTFAVHPNFEHWAPWIGKNTRKSETVLNTEFEKLSSSKSSTEAEVSMVSEDRLVDELIKQKVKLHVCIYVLMFDLPYAAFFFNCSQ